jgi:hypothetical protein
VREVKVFKVTVALEPDDSDDDALEVTAVYDAKARRWAITGAAYPRHLRMLAAIVDAIKVADSSRGSHES